ncbi:MAG: hypothetical protein WCP28_21680, partial [Actinomycetes bacterium]
MATQAGRPWDEVARVRPVAFHTFEFCADPAEQPEEIRVDLESEGDGRCKDGRMTGRSVGIA